MGKLFKLREMTTQRRSIPVEVALAASATGASHDSLGFQPQDPSRNPFPSAKGASHDSLGFQPQDPSPPASPALKARSMSAWGFNPRTPASPLPQR